MGRFRCARRFVFQEVFMSMLPASPTDFTVPQQRAIAMPNMSVFSWLLYRNWNYATNIEMAIVN